MKNKIKNLVFVAITAFLINGCNVLAIPTYVSKDVSFGVILVNNLQDKNIYDQEIVLDLTSLVSQDELDAVQEVKLTELTFTLNSNYENSLTGSKSIPVGGGVGIYKLNPGHTFQDFNSTTIDKVSTTLFYTLSPFNPNEPVKSIPVSNIGNVKDLIVDGKINLIIRLVSYFNINNPIVPIEKRFNDNSFSFTVSVKTEVLLEQ